MNIINMRVNHIVNPIGYDVRYQTFTWNYEEEYNLAYRISECRIEIAEDENFDISIFDSRLQKDISNISYELKLELKPCTRYFWRVTAKNNLGEMAVSDIAFFETGKLTSEWLGKWVCIKDKQKESPIVRKEFFVGKSVKCVRGYITGLGLYECYFNGQLVNDGYLQPGFNNYNFWIQYQTYDITNFVKEGENVLSFFLGAGWYKGRFGVNGGSENNFGNHYHLLCELHIEYEDGEIEIVGSDKNFRYTEGPVVSSSIYDGEIYDATMEKDGWMLAGFDDLNWENVEEAIPEKFESLSERYSVPVVVKERIHPLAIIRGKNGETILDMGQNISGWLTFMDTLEKGKKVILKYVELLQDESICQKNLLTAKQEFIYISDGKGKLIRPHFTYYGFRYVQVEGFEKEISLNDFEAWNLYSNLETTGELITGNDDVNQFIKNAFWSQKDNFIDQPTDCPQRAERLGWTGDAQIYCATANFNMYTPAFFRKYIKDVNMEQVHRNGMVPFIVPKIKAHGMKSNGDESSAGWSDVATIIPWTLYVYYGDKNLLEEEYPGMKAWVEYIITKDKENGNNKLWQSGFHFGDWLALDNPEQGPFGLTDKFYIASCYYYYSTNILANAAKILKYEEDAVKYENRALEIKEAIQKEYFDENYICKIDTQTSYALSIYMDIISKKYLKANGKKLVEKIQKNNGHLDTGFIGTAYLSLALSKAGYSDVAYDLLLKDDFPSWLYQVKMGATTVWESWKVIDETGKLREPSSLNHYAFGVVVEWLYRDVCGINPMEEYPGFQKVLLKPHPNKKLGKAECRLNTPAGKYEIMWHVEDEEKVRIKAIIPFNGSAFIILPDTKERKQLVAGQYEFVCDLK